MTPTATNKEFLQRISDAPNGQDRDAFTAPCVDDSLLYSSDTYFQGFDAVTQNSVVAGYCEITRQRRRQHVSR